eukprot:9109041-Pyramimonas_sp.AAC.1
MPANSAVHAARVPQKTPTGPTRKKTSSSRNLQAHTELPLLRSLFTSSSRHAACAFDDLTLTAHAG